MRKLAASHRILKSLGLSALLAVATLQAAPWQAIPSLDTAGYTSVAFFNGKYYAFAGQGPDFWESDDGLNFTSKSGTGASAYEVEVLGDTLVPFGYASVQATKDASTFPYLVLTGADSYVTDVERDGDTFYAATEKGLWISTNGGTSWTAAAGNASLQASGSLRLSAVIAWEGKILVGTNSGPQLSTDGGASFNLVTTGIDAGGSTMRVASMLRSGDTVWVVISGFRILHKASLNNLTWQVVDKKFNSDLLYADSSGGIYRLAGSVGSIDKSINGTTWAPIFSFNENNTAIPFRFMIAGDYAYFCSRSGKQTLREEVGNLNAPGENIFHSAYDLGQGWFYSNYLGYFWTGAYPWIWTPALGWTYIHGPNEKGFYAFDPSFGWFFVWKDYFPYIYVFKNGEGYSINMAGNYPNTRFIRASDSADVDLAQVGVLNFNFNSLAGKTITFSDSIGNHTLVINSFNNDSDRGDLTMKINGQTQTFSNVQLTYTNITGPRILLQAQAVLGDTTLGSSVQTNLIFDKATSGTTNYIGYAIFAIPPVTGGSGVQGTFAVQ